MDLFVIQSEKFSANHFFIVDENNFQEKILKDKTEFIRLQTEEELSTLEIFQNGGNEKFEIIKGKSYDFFVALIKKTFR